MICRMLLSVAGVALLAVPSVSAQTRAPEPVITSIFPTGLQQGRTVEARIQARSIGQPAGVWTDCDAVKAEISGFDEVKPEAVEEPEKKKLEQSVVCIRLTASRESKAGLHYFRLVSSQGVSNALAVLVYSEPTVLENDLAAGGESRRRLTQLPVTVAGTIAIKGELDFYEFEAGTGQEFFFEVIPSNKEFDAQLLLYENASGWFARRQLRRLALADDLNPALKRLNPQLRYCFSEQATYLVSVGDFLGCGGTDYSYVLRVLPAGPETQAHAIAPAHDRLEPWEERDFTRRIGPDRLRALLHRTVEEKVEENKNANAALSDGGFFPIIGEVEPNHSAVSATELAIPQIVEGSIDSPGDVDYFRLSVPDGQRLAMEIETPQTQAPYFVPRISILDEAQNEILNNIYAIKVGPGEFIERVIEPKVTFTFQHGGQYLLQVQDITSRNGAPDFRYRILVRPQIPHVGRIDIAFRFSKSFDGAVKKAESADRLNLIPGEAKKIAVLTEYEEGFAGQVAIRVENLPPGVQAFSATEPDPERGRIVDEGKREWFRPVNEIANLVFVAAPGTSASQLPQLVRVLVRPVVKGKLGPETLVEEIPLMVVQGETQITLLP